MEMLDDDDGGGGEGGGGGGGGISSSGDSPEKKDEDKEKKKDAENRDKDKKEKEKENEREREREREREERGGEEERERQERERQERERQEREREKEREESRESKDIDIDKEKDKGGTSGCRLRGVGSRSSLAVPAGPVKPAAPIHHRPSKPCCFCWCCCCTCSWLTYFRNKCLAVKGNNNCKKRKESGIPDQAILFCESNEPPPSLEEIRCWGKSFDKLMRNTAGRKVFREFLKCEYSEENILFWLACEELKREGNPDLIEEKARFIYEDYISILSPKEVSLDSRVREIVNRNMISPTPHTFDEAQLQIYTLMHRDSYPRFVNSTLFKQLAQLQNGDSGSDGTSGAEAKSSAAQ